MVVTYSWWPGVFFFRPYIFTCSILFQGSLFCPFLDHALLHASCLTCSGVPCLCLAFWNTFIIGGFANGQLRLYDSESGVKVVEVTAHARTVVALDVAPSAGLVRG